MGNRAHEMAQDLETIVDEVGELEPPAYCRLLVAVAAEEHVTNSLGSSHRDTSHVRSRKRCSTRRAIASKAPSTSAAPAYPWCPMIWVWSSSLTRSMMTPPISIPSASGPFTLIRVTNAAVHPTQAGAARRTRGASSYLAQPRSGRRVCHSVACSYAQATRNAVASSNGFA
jgi:hypothetical protein